MTGPRCREPARRGYVVEIHYRPPEVVTARVRISDASDAAAAAARAQRDFEAENPAAVVLEVRNVTPEPVARSRTTVRVPRVLHSRVEAAARAEGRSMNTYIVECLERAAARELDRGAGRG